MSELQNVREQIAVFINRVEMASHSQCPFGGGTAGIAAWMESVGKGAEASQFRRLIERRDALRADKQDSRDE